VSGGEATTVESTDRAGWPQRLLEPRSRLIAFFLLAILYGTVASASFSGFYQKWALRDGQPRLSFVEMIDGTAHRPFVHRQMLPAIANTIDGVLPDDLKERIVKRLEVRVWWEYYSLPDRLKINFDTEHDYVLRYYVIYYLCVGFLFLSLFVLREICLTIGLDKAASTIAPPIFGLCLVYFFSMGGFGYDFADLFFMSLAVLWALKGRWLWLVPLTALATFDKEAFLFFAACLFPILLGRFSLMKSAAITLLLMTVAGVTYLFVRQQFLENPGAAVESWFIQSVHFYLDPKNLFAFETNYAVVTPRAYSLFWMIVIAAIYILAWPKLAIPMRRHIMLSAAMTAVLVLAFCGPGETRNYSMCYVGLLVVIAQNVKDWLARDQRALQAT
jgi:hypothetical protein